MSKQCICCGKEIPYSEYNFTCDFCKFEQMRIEEGFRKRLRYAYNEGRAAGADTTAKEVLLQVKAFIDKAEIVIDENNHCWQPDAGYNKEQIDEGFSKLCKYFEVEL